MSAVTGKSTGVQPLPGTSSSGNINFADVKSPAEVSDDAALKIVRRDAEFTRSWIESRYFNIRWIEIDLLYQSPPTLRVWEGTSMPKANIAKFTVATHVNAINSKLINGLFYEEQPFELQAHSSITANTARSIEEILSMQLNEMNFKQETKYGFFSCLLNGTGIWKWGWKDYYKNDYDFEPLEQPITFTDPITGKATPRDTQDSDLFKMTVTRKLCSHPYFENCDIRTVLVDPGCRTPDIRDAKFVIHEFPVTFKDLLRMRDEVYYNEKNEPIYRYNLPSEDEIRSWFETPSAMDEGRAIAGQSITSGQNNTQFVQHAAPLFNKTTEDPLDEPLLIQERWDNDKVLTVLAGQRRSWLAIENRTRFTGADQLRTGTEPRSSAKSRKRDDHRTEYFSCGSAGKFLIVQPALAQCRTGSAHEHKSNPPQPIQRTQPYRARRRRTPAPGHG